MTYLLGKMTIFLLAAGIFGIIIGWLLKRFFAIKHNSVQLNLFEDERKMHQQDMVQLEESWQEKYCMINKERHKTKGLLVTQEQENLRLLNTIKTSQQELKNEQLELQKQLAFKQQQNTELTRKYALLNNAE